MIRPRKSSIYTTLFQQSQPGSMVLYLFWGLKVKGHKSHKRCRRGSLHSCECWFLLVGIC